MDFVHNPYRCGPLRVGMYVLHINMTNNSAYIILQKYWQISPVFKLFHHRLFRTPANMYFFRHSLTYLLNSIIVNEKTVPGNLSYTNFFFN